MRFSVFLLGPFSLFSLDIEFQEYQMNTNLLPAQNVIDV